MVDLFKTETVNETVNSDILIDETMSIVTADENFEVISGNNALFVYTRYIHPDDVSRFTEALKDYAESGKFIVVRMLYQTGEYHWMLTRITDGGVSETRGHVYDINIMDAALITAQIDNLNSQIERYSSYLGMCENVLFSYDILNDDFNIFMTSDGHQTMSFYHGTLNAWEEDKIKTDVLGLNEVKELLAPCCKTVISFVFPAGEEHKNLDTVRDLYETLILNHFDRNDMLAALGGGVVGDLCGFAAATYLRGVAFMQIPTTLLSQVDSSIGGKTGVDFDAYKNMVGAFHMPKLVFTNINTLQTLPDNQFSAGMGEVIKHGLIKDAAYYEWLLENAADIWARKPEALRKTVTWSNEIKRAVVEKDPTEKGDRMLLNFGHTLGHAIEKLKNFELLHGECVALGALAAMKLSENRGMIKPEETNRFKEALGEFHIGTQVSGLEKDAIVAASKNDKKMDSGIIKFILIHSIGDAYVDRTVTEDEMKQALDQVLV